MNTDYFTITLYKNSKIVNCTTKLSAAACKKWVSEKTCFDSFEITVSNIAKNMHNVSVA